MTDDIKQIFEYGDYQTPDDFVIKVCEYLKCVINIEPRFIIEPTFGIGNFIIGSLSEFTDIQKLFGIEINNNYFNTTKERLNSLTSDNKVSLFNENIFTFDFTKIKNEINKDEPILIIGNPPWVTNSDLTSIDSTNLPTKDNFKGLSGLDAVMGKSNFDIAEYIILQLLREFRDYHNCYVAMLCKNAVGRNIVRYLDKYAFNLSDIKMLTFNAMDVFEVNCDACLFIMKIGDEKKLICDVYDFDNPEVKIKSFGWVGNNFISDIGSYSNDIDGKSQFEWRQGVKHDCAKVMELSKKQNDGTYINGFKQNISIEDTYVYPVLKSSHIKDYIITEKQTKKSVIVTQKRVREETNRIMEYSPRLWNYLIENAEYLDNRKSSIYKNTPRFSMFGIGDYTFKPYKVGISGFYKNPIFSLIYNEEDLNKSIMLDDTCYFIGFDNYKEALITMLLLNSSQSQEFLKSIAFLDSKRPYTKDVLMRVDYKKVTDKINYNELINILNNLEIKPVEEITQNDYDKYIDNLNNDIQLKLV